MENKTDLRIWAKSLRKTLPLDAISAKIVRKIRQNPEFQQAKNVLLYSPALAADKNCFRLGYGGGFYDRFLAQNKVKTITPAARQLLVEKLPVEKFDVPVDFVITD